MMKDGFQTFVSKEKLEKGFIQILDFLIDNIFVMFGGLVFKK
jgi:hypothetical protein